jgi:hypothetical protein
MASIWLKSVLENNNHIIIEHSKLIAHNVKSRQVATDAGCFLQIDYALVNKA